MKPDEKYTFLSVMTGNRTGLHQDSPENGNAHVFDLPHPCKMVYPVRMLDKKKPISHKYPKLFTTSLKKTGWTRQPNEKSYNFEVKIR